MQRSSRKPLPGWETLTPEERAGLKSALAEIWENCEHGMWQQFCFSTLTRKAVLELVDLVREARERHHSVCASREKIEAILLLSQSGSRRH